MVSEPRPKPRFFGLAALASAIASAGEPLIATHAAKGKARYRYYVSRALNEGSTEGGMRIPAVELESLVAEDCWDHAEWLWKLLRVTGAELPAPKPRKPKQGK